MMSPPPMMSAMPPQGYSAPPWQNQPVAAPAAARPGWQQPPWQGGAQAPQAPAARAPVFRGKGEDEPSPPPRPAPAVDARPAPLHLPSPEQLGLARASTSTPPAPDWNDIQRRLDQLGAVSLQQEKLLDGGYRVTCVLPAPTGSPNARVEAEGASLAQAIGLVLGLAEKRVKEN